ncbi:MAG: PAS domain-containing sensor histidine kinase [Alphaproteobacteria bacterium]
MPTAVGIIVGSLIGRVLQLQRGMRQANDELRNIQQRDERFRRAMLASDLAVWDWHVGAAEVFVSQGGRSILGGVGSGETVAEGQWKDWVHPNDQQRYDEALHAHLGGDTDRFECEYRVRHEDGRYLWVVDRAIAQRDANRQAVRISGVIAEITDRKTAEIALLDAKSAAEQASRTKSAFLANMSHELRTPLNAIIGFSEILKEQTFGPIGNASYAGYANDIWISGRHLLDIINDILDLSRVEAGGISLVSEIVDLGETAERATRMVEGIARAGNIVIDDAIGPSPVLATGDSRAVRQILINLLSNSIKFTPDGGTVRITAHEDNAGMVCLTVSDTGIGMSATDIPAALAPFHQIDNSMTRKYEGTGLGLPLAKALTELMDGRFALHSEPGRGTRVTISLPPAETGQAA